VEDACRSSESSEQPFDREGEKPGWGAGGRRGQPSNVDQQTWVKRDREREREREREAREKRVDYSVMRAYIASLFSCHLYFPARVPEMIRKSSVTNLRASKIMRVCPVRRSISVSLFSIYNYMLRALNSRPDRIRRSALNILMERQNRSSSDTKTRQNADNYGSPRSTNSEMKTEKCETLLESGSNSPVPGLGYKLVCALPLGQCICSEADA
jgi:hypothetical protein